MTATCTECHQPIYSEAALARRVGSGCWRKLTPAQRAARASPTSEQRSAFPPVPAVPGQLPLFDQKEDSCN